MSLFHCFHIFLLIQVLQRWAVGDDWNDHFTGFTLNFFLFAIAWLRDELPQLRFQCWMVGDVALWGCSAPSVILWAPHAPVIGAGIRGPCRASHMGKGLMLGSWGCPGAFTAGSGMPVAELEAHRPPFCVCAHSLSAWQMRRTSANSNLSGQLTRECSCHSCLSFLFFIVFPSLLARPRCHAAADVVCTTCTKTVPWISDTNYLKSLNVCCFLHLLWPCT